MRRGSGVGVPLAVALLACGSAASAAEAPPPAGSALYAERCASCHDHPRDRIPPRAQLATRSPEEVAQALTSGTMRVQSVGLSITDVAALAVLLTGRAPGPELRPPPEQYRCAAGATPRPAGATDWNGWGRDGDNSRYQPQPGLEAAAVPRLAVKWAFGLRGTSVYGQPTVAGGRLYVTSSTGRLYSIDAASGCTWWTFDAQASARTAVSVAMLPRGLVAFMGDDSATVYAVDAASGELLWQRRLDAHPMARITGAPVFRAGRLYVPVSSMEEVPASDPKYPCCTFRGAVAALDAASGAVLWYTHVIAAEPRAYRRSDSGTQLYGPAGGAVWNSPTIDAQRGLLYVGTGNSYTDIAAPATNAVVAIGLATGRVRWVRQLNRADNWVIGCAAPVINPCPPGDACRRGGVANCPKSVGPDADLGVSPILRTLADGRQVLLAGQKSGLVHALDPDREGRRLWVSSAGQGGIFGGVEWGMAADGTTVYAPVANVYGAGGHEPGGLAAIDIASGRVRWSAPPIRTACSFGARGCNSAQSQAATLIPGAVFSGAQDGHLRAYAADDGRVLWDFDTARAFPTVNGVAAVGGSLDHGGPVVVDGVLYVLSGYGRINGQPGNLLLALSVDGK
ncbi:MAG: PQQ-binding-like beta-propeller repeat protein [Steroidobacteraceae bacterium]